MSATIDAQGPDLERALTVALADLLDCDVDEVVLRLVAPGLGEVSGRVELRLEVDGASGSVDDGDVSDGRAEDAMEEREAGDGGAPPPQAEDAAVADAGEEISPEQLDEEAEAAADFLEGLLDAMDLPGDLRIKIHEDHAEIEVLEIGSGALIGRRGQTLEAIQELLRCGLQRRFERRCSVKVDAEGYRARRLEKLLEKAEEAVEEVLETGEAVRLEPMDVFERKAVHQLVAGREGVTSHSQGREPGRRVVVEAD